jgi:hypothetical protein
MPVSVMLRQGVGGNSRNAQAAEMSTESSCLGGRDKPEIHHSYRVCLRSTTFGFIMGSGAPHHLNPDKPVNVSPDIRGRGPLTSQRGEDADLSEPHRELQARLSGLE